MEQSIIKTIIREKRQEVGAVKLLARPVTYERTVSYVNVGMRRAGKSWLLYQDIQEQLQRGGKTLDDILLVNFEDERIIDITAAELGQIIDCCHELSGPGKPLVYLDEIQNISGWQTFARRLSESGYRVMVTGSNANMLSKEIATTLGGAFVVREVFPFSWREYLSYHGLHPEGGWEHDSEVLSEARRRFDEYFYNGGLAETFSLANKREWLTSLMQRILMGDILSRYKIRKERLLRLLVRELADNVMLPTPINHFEQVIKSSGEKTSLHTIKDYLGYLEESYLLFSISNYASPDSGQDDIRKRYFTDNGLLNLYLCNGEAKLHENLLALHLRKLYWTQEEPGLFFYQRGSADIDFYIPGQRMAIQACYDYADPQARERKIASLVNFSGIFRLDKALVISYDTEERIEADGLEIEVTPIWKWLLQ